MIVTIATPSSLADFLTDADGRLPVALWRGLATQSACGPAWLFGRAPADPPLAAAGIVHINDTSEAWFAARDGASSGMVGLVRAFRPLLAQERRLIGRSIFARVRVDNIVGLKLAALCGFARVVDIENDCAVLEADDGRSC